MLSKKMTIFIISILLLINGCSYHTQPVLEKADKPSDRFAKSQNQVRVKHRVAKEKPYMANYGVHQSQFYSCLSSDGTHSMPCMIKRAKRGLYEFNQRVTELNRALGDCDDCGY